MAVANDNPFVKGEKVSVRRTRHGWHDGALVCCIKSCHKSVSGTWSYTATAVPEDAEWAGSDFEILHTRDARRML